MPTDVSGTHCDPATGLTDWKETARQLHKIATFYFDCVFDSSLSNTESFHTNAKALDKIENLF